MQKYLLVLRDFSPKLEPVDRFLLEHPGMKIHENQFSNFPVVSYVQAEGRTISGHPVSACAESLFTKPQKHTKELMANMQIHDII
jgi:hypothetical protein